MPIRWAKSDGPTPRAAYSRRLQFAHRAWTHTAGAEGEPAARSWFIGANPVLHEATPLTAIRNDRGEDLMLAVKILLEDTPDTRSRPATDTTPPLPIDDLSGVGVRARRNPFRALRPRTARGAVVELVEGAPDSGVCGDTVVFESIHDNAEQVAVVSRGAELVHEGRNLGQPAGSHLERCRTRQVLEHPGLQPGPHALGRQPRIRAAVVTGTPGTSARRR